MTDYTDNGNLPVENRFSWSVVSSHLPNKPNDIILVLNSIDWFIGDIDDLEINWFEIVKCWEDGQKLQFRFYRTHKGFRFFVTNERITTYSAKANYLFNAFQVDPAYVGISKTREHYAARLSPKDRGGGTIDHLVATLIYETVPVSQLDLEVQTMILTHDYFCSERLYHGIFRGQSSRREHANEEF